MSRSQWKRHADEDVAVNEILDAAGRTFAHVGVARATMIDVARAAGCSRATLYRYFPNQDSLHLAFVHRATLRIALRIAAEPTLSLTDRIIAGIAAIRSDPLLAAWFKPENLAVPLRVSQNSELLQALSAAQVGGDDQTEEGRRATELRGAWLTRSIVSLLAMPASREEDERELIESFIVPAVLAEHPKPKESR